jgi:hypothetical protein
MIRSQTSGRQASGRARFPWVRLAARPVVGAVSLFVLLVPLLAQEGEPSTSATVYGYLVLGVAFVAVGASTYRLMRGTAWRSAARPSSAS